MNRPLPLSPAAADYRGPVHPAQQAAIDLAGRKLRLTPRWTRLDPHRQQSLFVWHPARFKINPSGRRSGKTELVKRMAVLQLIKRRPWAAKIFLAAPTFGQARDIFWQDIKDLVPAAWVASISETRLELVTKWGALIRVFGFDRPRRIEGVPWDWGAIDEMADCPRRCFTLNVRPALGTRGREGGCAIIGVPDEVGRNQAEHEDLFSKGLQWAPGKDTCSFHWTSSDIIPEEAAAYAEGVDALAYQQEMGGQFVTSGGRAIYDFDPAFHCDPAYCTYHPRLPLDWSLDFGVTPAASVVCQSWGGSSWVLREIEVKDGSTDVQLEAFRGLMRDNGWKPRKIRVFGDAAGSGRHSPLGETDYQVLEERTGDLPIEWCQLQAPPFIKDTVNAVRGRVKSATGMVKLHVHPSCKLLVENIKTAPWPDKLVQFHALAALRYYCYSLYGSEPSIVGVTPWNLPALGKRAAKAPQRR